MLTDKGYVTVDEGRDNRDSSFKVVAKTNISGGLSPEISERIFYMEKTKTNPKFIEISLSNSSIVCEPGSLYFMKGDLNLHSSARGGLIASAMRKFTSGETIFQNTISGTGTVVLEPTFSHFLMIEMQPGEKLIVDQGSFYCGSGHIKTTARMVRSISGAIFGGEGIFQTEIECPNGQQGAIVILNSIAPPEEIMYVELEDGEELAVDGNFAVARTGSVEFSASLSGGSLLRTAVSGELLLQTFVGPGAVFLSPIAPVYETIKEQVAPPPIPVQK